MPEAIGGDRRTEPLTRWQGRTSSLVRDRMQGGMVEEILAGPVEVWERRVYGAAHAQVLEGSRARIRRKARGCAAAKEWVKTA